MSPTDYIICALVGLLVFWALGGVSLRLGGLLLIFAGAAGGVVRPDLSALVPLVIGVLMWFAGHWHYALRHQEFKSPLARHVFCRWAPEWLDPTAGWASPVVDRDCEERVGVEASSLRERFRSCRRRRAGRRVPTASAPRPQRVTEQGERIDVDLLRAFLKRTLADDAVADPVKNLLFEHVVAGRFHLSVVAESLPSYINEILNAATREDWQAVADELIVEAREMNGEV